MGMNYIEKRLNIAARKEIKKHDFIIMECCNSYYGSR